MAEQYEHDEPRPRSRPTALAIAHRRSQRIPESFERHRFLAAFLLGTQYRHPDDSHAEFRRALDADDSVTVAGLIEGIAATRVGHGHTVLTAEGLPTRRKPKPVRLLKIREREALVDAALGLSAFESSVKRGCGQSAIESRLRNVRKKFEVTVTMRAVSLALISGELTPSDLREGNV